MSAILKLLLLPSCVLSLLLFPVAEAARRDQPNNKAGPTSTDPRTGVTFPNRLGAFERDGGIKYDALGYPTAHYWAGRLILLSVFYYRQNPFPIEYANARDAVKILSAGARLTFDGSSNLHPSGRRAVFTLVDKFAGAPNTKLMSELMMFPHRDCYLTIRVTYPAAHQERARQEIDSFVRAFKLP
jgi:hypothetical protein